MYIQYILVVLLLGMQFLLNNLLVNPELTIRTGSSWCFASESPRACSRYFKRLSTVTCQRDCPRDTGSTQARRRMRVSIT